MRLLDAGLQRARRHRARSPHGSEGAGTGALGCHYRRRCRRVPAARRLRLSREARLAAGGPRRPPRAERSDCAQEIRSAHPAHVELRPAHGAAECRTIRRACVPRHGTREHGRSLAGAHRPGHRWIRFARSRLRPHREQRGIEGRGLEAALHCLHQGHRGSHRQRRVCRSAAERTFATGCASHRSQVARCRCHATRHRRPRAARHRQCRRRDFSSTMEPRTKR